jgi:hypothetical protein
MPEGRTAEGAWAGEYHEACGQKQTLQNLNSGADGDFLSAKKQGKSARRGFATNPCL